MKETIFSKPTGKLQQQRLSVHFADDNTPIKDSVVVNSSSRIPISSTLSSLISKSRNEGITNYGGYDCYLIAALQVTNNNYITLFIHFVAE
jgi:hypothetical protein